MKALGRAILIVLVFLLPLTIHLGMMDSFDLPKMVLVYLAAAVLLCIWTLQMVLPSPPPSPLKGEGKMKGRLLWKTSPVDVPLLAYLIVLGLTTIFSSNPRLSLWGQYREYAFGFLPFLAFAVLFWMTVQFFSGTVPISLLAKSVTMSGTFVGVYAILQYFGWELFSQMPKAEGTRIWATLGNPIYLGSFLAMTIPVVFGVLLYGKTYNPPIISPNPSLEKRGNKGISLFSKGFTAIPSFFKGGLGRIILFMFLLVMSVALIFTLSRSAWVGLAVAMVIFGLSLRTKRSNLKGALLTAFVLVTLFVGALSVYRPARQRFFSIFNPTEASNAARLAGWKAAWKIFKEHPVLGAGPDTFKETFRAKRNLAYVRATGPYTTQNHVHNDLLQIAATSGVLGLGAYLWICVTIFLIGFKSKGRVRDKGEKTVNNTTGWFCGLAALFVQNQFNFSTVTTSALAAIYAGVLCAMVEIRTTTTPDKSGNYIKHRGRIFLACAALILISVVGVLCWRFLHADMDYKNGLAYMSAKDSSQAILCLEGAAKLNPNVVEYRLSLANAYRDMAAVIENPNERLPFLKKALFQAQEIVRLELHNPDSHTNLGVAFMWLTQLGGEDHRQEAWDAFRRAVEIDQFSVETWAHLARTAHFLGDVEKEKQLWQKVLDIDPNHNTAKQMVVQNS